MHYQCLSYIQVQQIPTDEFPDRDKLIIFSFLNKYEGVNTWQNLTQTFKITLPKKIKVKAYKVDGNYFSGTLNANGYPLVLGNIQGDGSNLSGTNQEPTFLRGDLIKVNIGYRAIVNGGESTMMTGSNGIPNLFEGVISSINPNLPFEIECEDYMWLLKQVPTPARQWGNMSIQNIVSQILNDAKGQKIFSKYNGYVNLSVSNYTDEELKFELTSITTIRESLAQFLARIKAKYKLDSYFTQQTLNISYIHHVSAPQKEIPTFGFQKNIISNNLKWQRTDDLNLSIIIKSNYLTTASGTTIDGQQKTKHACTEVLVYNVGDSFYHEVKEKGKALDNQFIGQRYNITLQAPITDVNYLVSIGISYLKQKLYNGFTGTFTTFGLPLISIGDTVRLVDKVLTERNGLYRVRSVVPHGGTDEGYRQEIELDYKVEETDLKLL